MSEDSPSGVYWTDDSGSERLVHEYTEEDYDLADILDCFGVGSMETEGGSPAIILDDAAIRRLKVAADAESFDHPEDFILMCLDIHRFAAGLGPGPHRFLERIR